ncbi:MAG: trifunctional dihydropteroate synthetase [Alectoria sarmentosa]|nr:MAG: trifunctional dihydropteroate synthetase [Alectoria sarmentosa]
MVERIFNNDLKNESYTSCNVHLDRHQYEKSQRGLVSSNVQSGRHRAYLALGSNLGNRVEMIESAVREMSNRGLGVLRTSALYETKPMYLENQESFINGACEIETSLSPMDLLDQLKLIENDLGRVKIVENGPRTIDLDILLYDEERVENSRLSIPHKRMLEREFVLRPLCDLIPEFIPPTPDSIATYQDILEQLPKSTDTLSALTPLSDYLPPVRNQSPTRPTHLMAILNLTPDSFSDGGLHSTVDPKPQINALRSYATHKHPVTILDIGGQSTRPHATPISPEEELSRVLPTIKALRSDPSFQKMAVSIDTYRAFVAAEAVKAGADIINDVSAGQLDPEMLPTIARLGCTCVLMHMRGTPETMSTLTSYPDGVINGVGNELLERIRDAEKAGIRRWRMILDPGIGFAKTQAQNLELLRRFSELRDFEGLRGFPWVVGASRKGFIGKITGVQDAKERKWGTATTVAAAIQGGADIVRVHDVREMGEVMAMADAIWRI